MADQDATRDPLEALASEFIERQRRGEDPSVSEYAEKYPELADDIRELFPTIAATERLKARRERSSDGRASLGAVRLERLGDFRILREIGRGGMGIVYEAEQESLGRRVAIKVLPRQALLDAKHLKRFQREARIAASLHHTNIVEVFGVGEQDGFHYYVMQLIQGVGLDALIGRLAHQRRGGSDKAASPAADEPAQAQPGEVARILQQLFGRDERDHWRGVAAIGLQVAGALHYAHGQGTLHRDIKPANLLGDVHGVVWVTDFGLAKALQSENVTVTGDIAGTLRYMAPEQLAGQTDARSDVYGLGLALYELLTLRPAYEDADRTRLLRRIAHEPPAPPRRLNPRIPRDLETIVLKAIARDPEHRYRSAGALAADLQCFLEDRPIRARRASSVERLWRWCRRNPAVAGLAAATLLSLALVAVVATAGYVRTSKALEGEARERAKAEANAELAIKALEGEAKERAKAEANAELAIEAVDRIFERFSPSRTVASPKLTVEGVEGGSVEVPAAPVLSREAAALLEEMLAFYGRLATQTGDEDRLRRKAAEASRRVGDIRQLLGQYDKAATAYLRAIAVLQELSGRSPEKAELKVEVARTQNDLGRLRQSMQGAAEARQSHLDALATLQPVASASPALPEARYELARTHYLLGTRDRPPPGADPRGPGQPPPPRRDPDRGRPRPGPPPPPPEPPIAPGRADPDRVRKAERDNLAKAVAVLKGLVEQYPSDPRYRHLLALCYLEGSSGGPQSRSGDREEAVSILERLAEAHPEVSEYRFDLSEAYARVRLPPPQELPPHGGPSPGPPPDSRGVEERLRKALALTEKLVAENPHIPQYAAAEARNHHKLGSLLRQMGRLRDAEVSCRKAVALQSSLAAQFPDSPSHRVWLGAFTSSLAEVLVRVGQPQEARSLLEVALKALSALPGSNPELWFVHGILARSYATLAAALRQMGEESQASQAERQAEEHRRTLRRGPSPAPPK